MKCLSLLLLLFALSCAAKLNIPTSYTSVIIFKASQLGIQIKGTITIESDGSKEHVLGKFDGNMKLLDTESFVFKTNATSYRIMNHRNGSSCIVDTLNDKQLEAEFQFEQLNEKGEGPGDKCTGPAGKSGSMWTMDKFKVCVSDDGTTPYWIDAPDALLTKAPINFTAQAPAASAFQLPDICFDLDTKTLNLPKVYFADIKTEQSGYTTIGNVTRHENGDCAVLEGVYAGAEDWFVASEQKSYSLRQWSGSCVAINDTYNYNDQISQIISASDLWKHSKEKCLDGKGDVWARITEEGVSLCTNSDGTEPVFYKDNYKTITWSNFRTNDLPPFVLPEQCKSA